MRLWCRSLRLNREWSRRKHLRIVQRLILGVVVPIGEKTLAENFANTHCLPLTKYTLKISFPWIYLLQVAGHYQWTILSGHRHRQLYENYSENVVR